MLTDCVQAGSSYKQELAAALSEIPAAVDVTLEG